ncbi:MAG: conjugative transposon protein TraM [Bergeyella sp.]
MKKINFKQKKYILPLIVLPGVLLLAFLFSDFTSSDDNAPQQAEELDLSLGEVQDSILSKNDAYDILYDRGDRRTMLGGLDKEQDSLMQYEDGYSDRQKRYIDSMNAVSKAQIAQKQLEQSYYKPNQRQNNDNGDYHRSAEIIRMLNEGASGNSGYASNTKQNTLVEEEKPEDPVKTLKRQMLLMDSLEKARDPEYQANLKAEERLKKNREKMERFLNSTLKVNKSSLNPSFNSISKNQKETFIKAVIDENIKGFLGSRIRFRLLEDINVGSYKIPKGSYLYGQISGFTLQRVNLNVVSILSNGEILPINLSVYDLDGMQGLYVPASAFREMMREMGQNSVQGTQMQSSNSGFFSSMASQMFQSTSQTIANLIRKNKAKLKYNTYIYLINEKDLNKNEY